MAKYKLLFKKSTAKDLRNIPNKDVARILQRIEELSQNPLLPDSLKLTNQQRYRVRQGAYRILYEIKDFEIIVLIVKIAHRKELYHKK